MSKQSKLRRLEKRKIKAIAKSLSQTQNNPKNSSPNAHPHPKNGEGKPKIILPKRFFERPGFLAIVGTVFLGLAGFVQSYSHGGAIVILFFSLLIYLQAIRIEIEEHIKSKLLLKWVTGIGIVLDFSICMSLHFADIGKRPMNTSNENQTPKVQPKPTLVDEINKNAKLAIAKHWEPPEFPTGAMGAWLIIGGNESEFWETPRLISHVPLEIGPEGVIVLPYLENNRVYVKAQLPFGGPETTVKLNDEWPPKLPDKWDGNFNSQSLEIVDENTNPVFQIRYDSPTKIEVYGVFVNEYGAISIAFDGIQSARPGLLAASIPKVKAWFKYPSKDHLEELADQ